MFTGAHVCSNDRIRPIAAAFQMCHTLDHCLYTMGYNLTLTEAVYLRLLMRKQPMFINLIHIT